MIRVCAACAATIGALPGCAHIDFGGDGLTYYDPKPYLFVSTNKECVTTAVVVSVPEAKKAMRFKTGYGSAELSATLANGMIASVGQKTDTKIPETITSIAALGTAVGTMTAAPGKQVICKPQAILYPIMSGVPDLEHPMSVPVTTQVIDVGAVDK